MKSEFLNWNKPLLHLAAEYFVREFGKDKTKRDLDNPDVLYQTVVKKFDELSAGQFGESPKPAVLFQIALAKQRLKRFARKQAERRKEGWQIIETEKSFRVEDKITICDGMILTGKIDRIDKRIKDGITEYAVLDYKSSDTAITPDKVHRQGKKEKEFPAFQYQFLKMA
ncbi:hypothetical protein FACS1894170_11500 [Planctomycetales bacterium]|nr:hypothetical protein FACS1894170_11500 [Planctomycetales bacterium]